MEVEVMKRTFKFAIFAILPVLALSCAKEVVDNGATLPEGEEMVLDASFADTDTKTYFGQEAGGKIPVCWNADDLIWVSSNTTLDNWSKGSVFSTSEADISKSGTSALFKGVYRNDGGKMVAVYPYEYVDAKLSSYAMTTIRIPEVQQHNPANCAQRSCVSAAYWTSGNTIRFSYLVGCMKLSLKGSGQKVSRLVLIDRVPDHQLWGVLQLKPSEEGTAAGTVTVKNGSNYLTVQCGNTLTLGSTPVDFYVMVPAGSFSQGLAVALYAEDGSLIKAFETSLPNTVAAGSMVKMPAVSPDDFESVDPDQYAKSGEFSGGKGTASDPYLISNPSDFFLLSELCASEVSASKFGAAHYRQTADIDFEGFDMMPVGETALASFSGSYDGAGFKVKNLSLKNSSNSNPTGLFGYAKGATIKDIELVNPNYNVTSVSGIYTGGIAGVIDGGSITSCKVTAAMLYSEAYTSFDGYAGSFIGGIVGYALNSTVDGCSVSGTVSAGGMTAGGVVGHASGTTVKNCILEEGAEVKGVKVSGEATNFYGGIVGRTRNGSAITDCTVNGTVSASGNYVGGITGHLTLGTVSTCTVSEKAYVKTAGNHVGGIVGALQANEKGNASIVSCVCRADVSGAQNTGGIAGYHGANAGNRSSVTACDSYGKVTSTSYNAGGISGSVSNYNECVIESCRSFGDVSASGYDVGGIFGLVSFSAAGKFTVCDCIAYGNVTGQYAVGGIGGRMNGGASGISGTVNIYNDMYLGETLEGIGNNGANGYVMVAGIVGWHYVQAGTTTVANCVSRAKNIKLVSAAGGYPSKSDAGGGIFGFQNGTATSILYNAYSTVKADGFYLDGKVATPIIYGGIAARAYCTDFKYSYYDPSLAMGSDIRAACPIDAATVKPYASAEELLANLNAGVAAYTGNLPLRQWVAGEDGFPVLKMN